ncbi:MAG TPA: 50S ribosomal protein L11 methyltransferase [Thermoanaerobaculia bacterium]
MTKLRMTDYILEISFDPDLEEVVQGRLFLTRSTGSVSVQHGVIRAYFETTVDRDAAAAALSDFDVAREETPSVDWLRLYQQSLQPLFVGRSFVIAPDASLIPADTGRHTLVIPQEQAFGTGSHESSALCIELLEDVELRGKRALDAGAGTGVLALAMLRLGAAKVVAFDNDLDAFRPLRANRARNGAALPLFIGSVEALRGGRFDVITMNILPEVIVRLLPEIRRHLDGALILSGILIVQREYVVDACERHRLRFVSERQKGEWWAGTCSV